MLPKIRKRTQGALLREVLLYGEANFRTLAEHRHGCPILKTAKQLKPGLHSGPRVVRDEASVRTKLFR